MSSHHTLKPGDHVSFSTRPVGLSTSLFIQGSDHDSVAIWQIVLCCKPEHKVIINPNDQQEINISAAAGALVTVRNDGWADFNVWTDY